MDAVGIQSRTVIKVVAIVIVASDGFLEGRAVSL